MKKQMRNSRTLGGEQMARRGRPGNPPAFIELPGWGKVLKYESSHNLLRLCPSCENRQYYRKKSDTFRCTSCGTISGLVKYVGVR